MKTTYSLEPFEGFTHRFKVQFEKGDPYFHNLDIYSNSDSYDELLEFINKKKTDKVISFKIVHRATRHQDELSSEMINELLNGI